LTQTFSLTVSPLNFAVAFAATVGLVVLAPAVVVATAATCLTGFACALLVVDVGVFRRELVAPLAMGFARVFRAATHATQDVLASCDGLHVVRINAAPVAAQVVDAEALGNRAPATLEGKAMRQYLNPILLAATDVVLAVAVAQKGAAPIPASGVGILGIFGTKAGRLSMFMLYYNTADRDIP
jgi:hypothetical protein